MFVHSVYTCIDDMISLSTELRYHTYCLYSFHHLLLVKTILTIKLLFFAYLELQKDYFILITEYYVESVNLNQHLSQKTLRVSNVNHPLQKRNYLITTLNSRPKKGGLECVLFNTPNGLRPLLYISRYKMFLLPERTLP